VHLFDASGDDLGFCHLSGPVAIGDLAAAEGATDRRICVPRAG
jgi:hypothetical protein